MMKLAFAVAPPLLLFFVFLSIISACFVFQRRRRRRRRESLEAGGGDGGGELPEEEAAENLIRFAGGEDLAVHDILDAPGEVVGKSGHGTLYRAALRSGSVVALRFVRPAACAGRSPEILPAVSLLGSARHPNLVPLTALYLGPRGEKLFVHPFYHGGTLSQLLHDSNGEAMSWEVIHKLSLGIAKGLGHLHNGLQKQVVHGNLKASNILLDGADRHPRISDFGLHLVLNPAAGQEMIEAAAAQGYGPPELVKAKDAGCESDVYNLGVIFLQLFCLLRRRKEPAGKGVMDCSGRQEERLLAYFELSKACCSPKPSLRPSVEQVVGKLEEVGR